MDRKETENDERVKAWLSTGKNLPHFLRDFHDAKDFFKFLDSYKKPKPPHEMPGFSDGMIYVLDYFLWCMGQHGYTLQRNRTDLPFRDIEESVEGARMERTNRSGAMLAGEFPSVDS